MQPLVFQTNNSGMWYTGDDVLNTTMRDLNTAAEYSWAHYDIPIVVTFTNTIKNAGDPRVLSLVATSIEVTEMSAANDLGTGIFSSGSNAKQIGGLNLALSTSSTVGGIAQGSYSWWQAKMDSSTTNLTLEAIGAVISDCTYGDRKRPTLLVGDRDMFDRIVDRMVPSQRFEDSKLADAGFQNVMVRGVPFVIDSHMDSTDLFVLTEDHFKLCYAPEDNFRLFPFQMPVNQRVMIARLGWSGQLVYSSLRTQGGFTAITS